MAYPVVTADARQQFRDDGYLVVRGAIDPGEFELLREVVDRILADKEHLAFDWAWDAREARDARSFRIVQASPSRLEPALAAEPFRQWGTRFASELMGRDCEFWYDQFLAKPPGEVSVPTPWHQDEGYWGRNLDERGISCWLALHDVNVMNGCMHFIPGGHRDGVLSHRQPDDVASDLLYCDVDEVRALGSKGEGDHYPWKIYVNQFTGERSSPGSR